MKGDAAVPARILRIEPIRSSFPDANGPSSPHNWSIQFLTLRDHPIRLIIPAFEGVSDVETVARNGEYFGNFLYICGGVRGHLGKRLCLPCRMVVSSLRASALPACSSRRRTRHLSNLRRPPPAARLSADRRGLALGFFCQRAVILLHVLFERRRNIPRPAEEDARLISFA